MLVGTVVILLIYVNMDVVFTLFTVAVVAMHAEVLFLNIL